MGDRPDEPKTAENRLNKIESVATASADETYTSAEDAPSNVRLESMGDPGNAVATATTPGFWSKLAGAAPLLALLGTLITIVVQARSTAQLTRSTAQLQQKTSEDEQWRDALKLVSFKDSDASETAVYALQGFFGSVSHGVQAQRIASTLLINVRDVKAFDAILGSLRERVDSCLTFVNVSSVATSLGLAQRANYDLPTEAAATPEKAPFLREADRLYLGDVDKTQQKQRDLYVSAWKIASASDFMRDIWQDRKNGKGVWEGKDRTGPLCSNGTVLVGAVLENAVKPEPSQENFDGLDFSRVDFSFAIFSNAHFQNAIFKDGSLRAAYLVNTDLTGAVLRGVDLTGANLDNVELDRVDLTGIKGFRGSKWNQTKWWKAKCLPQPLFDYLRTAEPPPKDIDHELLRRLAAGCDTK